MFTKPARGSMSDNAPMTDTDATADVTASVTTDTTDALDAGLDADSVFTSNDIRTLEPAHPGATAPSAPAPHAAHHSSGNFPSIGDYAFLSDCEANCLIAPSGAVEWMCVPRPDSPSIFTAILAASIAFTQRDIKRVLAYSTVSQLGYMFLAMGVGAFGAGIFHLYTHCLLYTSPSPRD